MDTRTIRVLLVDDDEDDYVMTRDMLAELGRGAFLLDWVSSYEDAHAAVGRFFWESRSRLRPELAAASLREM